MGFKNAILNLLFTERLNLKIMIVSNIKKRVENISVMPFLLV
jgi:hypothetical protein